MTDERGFGQEGIYHIRVKGSLDERSADWFEGFVVASRAGGETLLTGPIADQAALHGVLDKIHGLSLSLLLVAQIDCPCSKKRCPRHGHCGECAAYHGAQGKLPFCSRERTRWERRWAALTKAR